MREKWDLIKLWRERKKPGRWWSELLHLHSRTSRRVSLSSQPGRSLVWNLYPSSLLAVTSHVSNFSNSKKCHGWWLRVEHTPLQKTRALVPWETPHTPNQYRKWRFLQKFNYFQQLGEGNWQLSISAVTIKAELLLSVHGSHKSSNTTRELVRFCSLQQLMMRKEGELHLKMHTDVSGWMRGCHHRQGPWMSLKTDHDEVAACGSQACFLRWLWLSSNTKDLWYE